MSESKVKELFQRALEQPAARRGAFLDRACGGRRTLRARVEALLNAHEEIGPFLSEPTCGGPRPQAVRETAGTVIGDYKLLQKIGEGGFGVVYMAEQTEPVRRNVALKIIKLGMDTKQVVARFDAERQALAVMDHPNIAKVLEAGATETGRPYFVMELVKGIPITRYCDQAQLDTAERLVLFQDVCRAVQHAHHKGIIHRDLKPSNILVTLHDGRPVPKVIDFGIAKATDHRLTQKTLFTEFRQMVGTPEYMAPEQAELGGLDIDTRADVYALGVVLYELLTGAKPFDLATLMERGYDELLRTIREVEPPKPSTRVSTMGDQVQAVAHNRHTQPKLLGRLIRGDLDWIVMKALEKDRSRRYDTADGFAQDIERYLQDQPVLASPPSGLYRVRKYVRRHRFGVAAAGAVLLSLAAGGVLAFAGYVEAARQRDLAQEAERSARRQAAEARTEAKKSAEVVSLMRDMLGSANPHTVKGGNYTVRQLLDDFDRDLGTRLEAEQEVEATVRLAMGDAYLGLGLPDRAAPHIERALEFNREAFGERSAPFADSLVVSALLLHDRGDYSGAEERMRSALEVRRGLAGDTQCGIANCLAQISDYKNHMGRYDDAERLAREALAIRREALSRDDPRVASSLTMLARVLRSKGEYDEAEKLYLKALAIRRKVLGDEHAEVAQSLNSLAAVLYDEEDYDEAEKLCREALAIERRVLGDDHPLLGMSLLNLAEILDGKGCYDEAEKLYRKALAIERRALGDDHPDVATGLNHLAWILYHRKGNRSEAERLGREALAIRRKALGGDHPDVARSLNLLGCVLCAKGDYDEAEKLHREALAIRRKALGDDHAAVGASLGNLADVLRHRGDYDGAEKLLREALAVLREALGGDSRYVASTLYDLGRILCAKGGCDEAEKLHREALSISRKVLGDDHPAVGKNIHALAHVAEKRKQYDQAEQLYREALRVHQAARSDLREDLACLAGFLLRKKDRAGAEVIFRKLVSLERSDSALALLGLCLLEQGKHAEAEPVLRECLAIREKHRAGTWLHYNTMSLLGGALAGLRKYAEAEPLLVEGYEKMAPPAILAYRKREALDRIVELYEAWGKPDKAAAWRARTGVR